MNKVTKLLTPYNFTNKNDTGRIKYIVIHYVGCLGSAKANCAYYASKYIGASAHYFVGLEGEIYQSVEDADIAWHCGAKKYKHAACRNSNSIGIEMCVRKKDTTTMSAEDKDWYFEDATVNSTISLTKELMKKYNVPVENVVRHYDVTGKICPNPYVKSSAKWKKFIAALKIEDPKLEKTTEKQNDQTCNYLITTTCDNLRIRAGAGTSYPIVGHIIEKAGKKKKYTIVDEVNGWGRLKSGVGWICLAFTKKT